MAPTPTNDTPTDSLSVDSTGAPKADVGYWTKANIAVTAVFALLALTIFVILLAFYLRRRSHKKKHAHRKSDKAALLQHEDKSTMFSTRERHSSVTLYVDEENEARRKRASQDTISLIPLQITPIEEMHDPITETTTASNGSGVSALSRLSTNTMSTMMLSPISPSEEGDLSVRQSGRPRSTSTASQRARYYETTPTDVERPPVPIIVKTVSD
jgi:hypothetical protein